MKGIEFTVTTLNCAQDQNNAAPEHRRKFSSLRKTGALSKAVRSKISKSFYSNSSSNKPEKMANIPSSDHEQINDIQISSREKVPLCAEPTATVATGMTTKSDKPEKHKKRSKLCQLL